MRYLLCFLYIIALASPLIAQPYGIINLSTSPQTINTQDSVYVNVELTFSTQQKFFTYQDTLIGNILHVNLSFCGGFLPAIDVRTERLNLGQLPVGDYQLICEVFEYGPAFDQDGMITDTCQLDTTYQDSLAFKVDLFSKTTSPISTTLRIIPNPASDFFQIDSDHLIQSMYLWSTEGKLIHSWTVQNTSETLFLPKIAEGMYLLEIRLKNQTPLWEKLVVR